MTVVMVSSELMELRSICDRIAIVAEGKVVDVLETDASDADFGLAMSGIKPEHVKKKGGEAHDRLRATRAQVIAAAVIAALAIVVGVVGLYGLNARGSESGAQVLEDMRLQAILNTAGSGAVDAYVAAAKSEASTKARESGGGMSAVRRGGGQGGGRSPREGRRARHRRGGSDRNQHRADERGARRAARGAAGVFRRRGERAGGVCGAGRAERPADDAAAADATDDTAEDDLTMEEETVDLSGFVATEAMNRLSAEVDDAYGALCGQIKAVFPALTDDVLATLKPTITGIVAVQNDRFELQYDPRWRRAA